MSYVRAVYEFQGNAGAQELSFPAGAEIYVTNFNIGDGWWEGNYNGMVGLFPESYVEMLEEAPPVQPPPRSYSTSTMDSSAAYDDWGSGSGTSVTPTGAAPGAAVGGKVGKSLNRFSPFVRTGAENFLLNTTVKPVGESHAIGDDLRWTSNSNYITVEITDPHTKSKLAGMREYTAYTVRSPYGEVERRFKHFEWLRDRLDEKFAIVPLFPFSPEKQFTGRFEEQFIQKRQKGLEAYINRLARHPLIRESEVFKHFLSCVDEKQWKNGKRTAEKDPVVGSKLIQAVTANEYVLPPTDSHNYAITKFGGFVKNMRRDISDILRNVDTLNNQMLEMSKTYGAMNERVTRLIKGSPKEENSATINDLKHWDSRDGVEDAAALTRAMECTAKSFADISGFWKAEPGTTNEPFCESLREYELILDPIPDLVEVHNTAYKRMQEAVQKDPNQASSLSPRANVIYSIALAETNRFHDDRIADFNAIMRSYLQSQIYHHQRIIAALEESLHMYQ